MDNKLNRFKKFKNRKKIILAADGNIYSPDIIEKEEWVKNNKLNPEKGEAISIEDKKESLLEIDDFDNNVDVFDWPSGIQLSSDNKVAVSAPDDIKILLTHVAFEQLFSYAYATSQEISCLGLVHREDNTFVVEKFYLVEQTGSRASTEMEPEAVGKLMEALLAEGKEDEIRRIKCWAHSHPSMGTFWSGTDDSTCESLTSDYLVSLVVSDKEDFEILGRIDIKAPIHITINKIPVLYELSNLNEENLVKYKKEVEEKVKLIPSLVGQTSSNYMGMYGGGKYFGEFPNTPSNCGIKADNMVMPKSIHDEDVLDFRGIEDDI